MPQVLRMMSAPHPAGQSVGKGPVELVLEPAVEAEAAVVLQWLDREGISTASLSGALLALRLARVAGRGEHSGAAALAASRAALLALAPAQRTLAARELVALREVSEQI